jgi:hypothetical protein
VHSSDERGHDVIVVPLLVASPHPIHIGASHESKREEV